MDNSIKLNPENWTYGEYIKFSGSFQGTGDSALSYELAEKLIVAWDYEVALEEGMYGLPSINEANRVLRTVLDLVGAYAEDIMTDNVVVDLNKWNLKRFLEFDKARSEMKVNKLEALMHEVCRLKGAKAGEPLTYPQGAMMMKAILDDYKRSLSGKN